MIERDHSHGFGFREALVLVVVALGAYAIITTELLSLGAGHELAGETTGNLTRMGLLVVWLPVAAFAVWMAVTRRASIAAALTRARTGWADLGRLERISLTTAAAIALSLGVIALVAAPNNWDSMTYHLVRVEQWARLQGVAHYPAIYEAQIYHPPGAEIFIAISRILTGTDRFAGLVQWGAFAVCIPAVTLAAARLGASTRGQSLAALVFAATPMAMMQATSTQNDLVLALWLLAAAVLAIGVFTDDGQMLIRVLAASAALGLALVTKGTGSMFALPVAALLAWAVIAKGDWRRVAQLAAAGMLIIVALNAGQWLRNVETYGTPIAAGTGENKYRTAGNPVATVISNAVRNTTNHLDTPVDSVNDAIVDVVDGGLGVFGIDAQDPDTTFEGGQFEVGPFGPHEDNAGNPIQLLLILVALGSLAFCAAMRSRERVAWAAAIVAQMLLFAALIKWQNWHARLHLPTFVLAAPLAAACVAELRWRRAVPLAVALLVLSAPLYVIYNYTRPAIGDRSVFTTDRTDKYFAARPPLKSTYLPAIDEIKRNRIENLAVLGPQDIWEYPFYALVDDDEFTLFDVDVTNKTGKYPNSLAAADGAVCLVCSPEQQALLADAGFEQIPYTPLPVEVEPRLQGGTMPLELWIRR